MEYAVGAVLALAVGLFTHGLGLARDRSLYPVIMIVIASYYILFAVMGGSQHALMLETLAAGVFAGAAIAGYRVSLWWVVIALAAHGVFDFTHGLFIANPGVPMWWPAFCLAYDVVAAGCLGWLLLRHKITALAPP